MKLCTPKAKKVLRVGEKVARHSRFCKPNHRRTDRIPQHLANLYKLDTIQWTLSATSVDFKLNNFVSSLGKTQVLCKRANFFFLNFKIRSLVGLVKEKVRKKVREKVNDANPLTECSIECSSALQTSRDKFLTQTFNSNVSIRRDLLKSFWIQQTSGTIERSCDRG